MRCFFVKDGHIAAVEVLTKATEDERISESRELFEERGKMRGAQGFEIWDEGRIVYRFPEPQ